MNEEEVPQKFVDTLDALTSREPVDGSEPFQRYLRENRRNVRFLFFTTGMVAKIDEISVQAAKALVKSDAYADIGGYADTISKGGAGTGHFMQRHRDIFMEMFLCRSVDNYLCYVAELLHAIFLAKPEALRSSEQERLDFVLKHSSMDSLVTVIAEKRVHQLSYQGMEAIADYFKDRLGLDMFEGEEDKKTTVDLIQKRNLIVHNRGVVNAIYLAKGAPGLAIGDKIEFTPEEFFEVLLKLRNAATHLDKRASSKFGLPTRLTEPDLL